MRQAIESGLPPPPLPPPSSSDTDAGPASGTTSQDSQLPAKRASADIEAEDDDDVEELPRTCVAHCHLTVVSHTSYSIVGKRQRIVPRQPSTSSMSVMSQTTHIISSDEDTDNDSVDSGNEGVASRKRFKCA
jgi:hypothetical protein